MKKIQIYKYLYCFLVPILFISSLRMFFVLLHFFIRVDKTLFALVLALYFTYGLVIPIAAFILMRFSLFKWYVDPFAAAELPLVFCLNLFIKQSPGTRGISVAFSDTLSRLTSDNGRLARYLLSLFFFALLASFSLKRKSEKSFMYRLLNR